MNKMPQDTKTVNCGLQLSVNSRSSAPGVARVPDRTPSPTRSLSGVIFHRGRAGGEIDRRCLGFFGDRVFHQKFGDGNVTVLDGNKLTIAFDRAGEKRVVDSFVERV